MPETKLIFFMEDDGTIPFIDWLEGLDSKTKSKSFVKLSRLASLGHELRRPEADYLRDNIYELRVNLRNKNYRILYFFHGTEAIVISHGTVKEQKVPAKEIEIAVDRRKKFLEHPDKHAYVESEIWLVN